MCPLFGCPSVLIVLLQLLEWISMGPTRPGTTQTCRAAVVACVYPAAHRAVLLQQVYAFSSAMCRRSVGGTEERFISQARQSVRL